MFSSSGQKSPNRSRGSDVGVVPWTCFNSSIEGCPAEAYFCSSVSGIRPVYVRTSFEVHAGLRISRGILSAWMLGNLAPGKRGFQARLNDVPRPPLVPEIKNPGSRRRHLGIPFAASGINHEFQEVAVRISHINAGGGLLAAALAPDGTFDDLCSSAIQHCL